MTQTKSRLHSLIRIIVRPGCGLGFALFTMACLAQSPGTQGPGTTLPALRLFLVGDSTMSDKPVIPAYPERGWGQMLPMYFRQELRIADHAVNGRSSKSFLDEGKWKGVIGLLKAGDYVIIQFGHNDENKKNPDRFTEPATFKQNLKRYVREAREAKAIPILATPVARRKFDDKGQVRDTHGDYSEAVRQLAAEERVPLLDLDRSSRELLAKLGPERSKGLYDWAEPGEFEKAPAGLKDDTHFNAFGASRICDLAVVDIRAAVPDLARWLVK